MERSGRLSPNDDAQTGRSRVSINNLCNDTEDQDMSTTPEMHMSLDAEMTAPATLGNFRGPMNAAEYYAPHQQSNNMDTGANSSSAATGQSGHLISMVSNIPIVRSTIDFYDKSKANSRVVRYSAEVVESSVRTISRPVLNRFEPQLEQLEGFAYRQLNRFQGHLNEPVRSNGAEVMGYANTEGLRQRFITGQVEHGGSEQQQQIVTTTNEHQTSIVATSDAPQRSRWQQILVTAGTAAGAGAAALSEEGMRSLKYCLDWLAFAVKHIEHQIRLLQSFINSITKNMSREQDQDVAGSSNSSREVAQTDVTALVNIRHEVVETLRKVVEVIGRYAGACLPREAREAVRNFILSLPNRWAMLSADLSTTNSVVSSPDQSPPHTPTTPPALMLPGQMGHRPQLSPVDSANRVMALANESLSMLKNVSDVFGQTKDRADALVERLRSIGYTPGGANDNYLDPYGRPVPAELLASRLESMVQEHVGNDADGVYVMPPGQHADFVTQQPTPACENTNDPMEF